MFLKLQTLLLFKTYCEFLNHFFFAWLAIEIRQNQKQESIVAMTQVRLARNRFFKALIQFVTVKQRA